MKITIDTQSKTISAEGNLGELFQELQNLSPCGGWKAYSFKTIAPEPALEYDIIEGNLVKRVNINPYPSNLETFVSTNPIPTAL